MSERADIPAGPYLEPTGKLAPQPWMTAPATRAVMAALDADRGKARFVGGCVRDAMAHRPVKDIDIATVHPPEEVMRRLEAAGIKALPIGLKHGTVTAVIGKDLFEITTLRRDVETDGRHAVVAFTDDWRADAARRDFTINALSCTPEGDVYDYFDGIAHLAHGEIRFVGYPDQRIDEDVLRLLRYFRFYAHYGRPPPDRPALAACRSRASKLADLSGERVRDELLKILAAPEPADIVLLMRGETVLSHLLPEAGDVGPLRMLGWLETHAIVVEGVGTDPVRRLACLLDTNRAGAEAVATRLRLSNAQKDRLAGLMEPDEWPAAGMGENERRRLLFRLGAERVRDLALIDWATRLSVEARLPRDQTDGWIRLLEETAAWTAPDFPVSGQDAIDLGIPKGPQVGRLLRAVQDWWEHEGCRPDRAACLEKMKSMRNG